MEEIKQNIKSFILKEFLPGEDPDELTDTIPLISGGILDSLATLRLVAYLEEQYPIEIQPHETGIDYMDTISNITELVQSKLSS